MTNLDIVVKLLSKAICRKGNELNHRMEIPHLAISQHFIYDQENFQFICCDSRDCPYEAFGTNPHGANIKYCTFNQELEKAQKKG